MAEISQVLHDRFTVNGFITLEATLDGYRQASMKLRLKALKGVAFLRTWCKDKSKGVAATFPPKHLKGLEKFLWKWRLPIDELDQLISVGEERWNECGWMLMQGLKDLSSSFEVSSSCWRWKRGISILI